MKIIAWTGEGGVPNSCWFDPHLTISAVADCTFGSRTYPVAYTYDPQGRMQTMTTWTNFGSLSGGATTTWSNNAYRGWLDNKRYADSKGPDYTYTAGGRLKTRTWARTGTGGNRILTTYTYGFNDTVSDNQHGDLVGISYSYDPQGTLGLTNTYDRRGRLVTVQQGAITTSLGYNNANQFLGEGNSGGIMDGLSITNVYDSLLRRTNVSAISSSALSAAAYGYDSASRLSTATNESGDWAAYTYLANSPLVSQIMFKQGATTRMTTTKKYDFLNRLTQIASAPSAGSNIASSYTYNSANQRTRNVEADGSYWRYQYDALGQVTAGRKYWADQTPVAGQQFTYSFDTIGNRMQAQLGGDQNGANLRVANYSANNLNQYTSRTVPGYLDVMGLVLATNSVTVNGATPYRKGEYFREQLTVANSSAPVWESVTVSAPNETTVSGDVYVPETPEAFGYDLDGNITNDGRWQYIWDAENRLVQMLPSGTNVPTGAKRKLDFVHDYKGRRVQKDASIWTGSAWSLVLSNRFVYDGWNLLTELNATNNAAIQTYLWGSDLSGSLQGAGGVGGLLAVNDSANGAQFAAYDGNGNVQGLVSGSIGGISEQYEYGPFAEALRATGPMAKSNPLRFSTKYQDDETELLYYGYRYYDPLLGRWLSRDPSLEIGGLNLYSFVNDSPLLAVDPFGLLPSPGCCKCLGVKLTNVGFHTYGTYPQFTAAYFINFHFDVLGDPNGCKCKQIENGTIKLGYPDQRTLTYNSTNPRSCGQDSSDPPGIYESTGGPNPWNGQVWTFHMVYNMSISGTCEDNSTGMMDTISLNSDRWFTGTFNKNGTFTTVETGPK
jgi:RHS repeat-associated protein